MSLNILWSRDISTFGLMLWLIYYCQISRYVLNQWSLVVTDEGVFVIGFSYPVVPRGRPTDVCLSVCLVEGGSVACVCHCVLVSWSDSEVLWRVRLCLCVCVCLSVREDISGTTLAIFTKFLCMLSTAVARSGRIHSLKSGGTNHDERAAPRVWGVKRRCPPPHRGRGLGRWLCPLPRIFLIFELKITSFGAFLELILLQ